MTYDSLWLQGGAGRDLCTLGASLESLELSVTWLQSQKLRSTFLELLGICLESAVDAASISTGLQRSFWG